MNILKNVLKGLSACITILYCPVIFLSSGAATLIVLVPDSKGFLAFALGLLGTTLLLAGLICCYFIGKSLNKNEEEHK